MQPPSGVKPWQRRQGSEQYELYGSHSSHIICALALAAIIISIEAARMNRDLLYPFDIFLLLIRQGLVEKPKACESELASGHGPAPFQQPLSLFWTDALPCISHALFTGGNQPTNSRARLRSAAQISTLRGASIALTIAGSVP